MADFLLQFIEPVCDAVCCNPPIKHTHDNSKEILDKTFNFGAANNEDFRSKSGQVGSSDKDFVINAITTSDNLTIVGANVSIGSIKLNCNVTIKATGTVVIGGIENYSKVTVTAKELYINNGMMNECILTALVSETVVIRGAETATGTLASLVNKCHCYVGFTKEGEDFKNAYPAKVVILEHKILNECVVRAFADKLMFKQELINSCVVNAYIKEYFLIGKSEDSSLINKCVINVFAYKIGDKSEQAELVEIQGRLLNECNIVANASLLWLNDGVLNNCNIQYVGKIQQKCGLYMPWRRAGSVIAQDPNMTGVTLNAETSNPLQA